MEQQQYADNAFITLTYSEETLPAFASLVRKDLQDFLKRLRARIAPARVRYYAVGEYGDTSHRPHYHIAMFGYPNCRRGMSRFGLAMPSHVTSESKCCDRCDLIADTWQKGGIYVGALNDKSAQYVAGYVMKKMTHRKDSRLNGREPKSAVMSRRPGIGVMAMHDLADVLMRFDLETKQPDVPSVLQVGKKKLPLARHLRVTLRKLIGKDEKAPLEVLRKMNEEMLVLLQGSIDNKEADSLRRIHQKKNAGKVASIQARFEIQQSRMKKL